jgi:hypothetical protein
VAFPLIQRIALPITLGSVRYPSIKIQDTRIYPATAGFARRRQYRRRLDRQTDP